jgi:CRP/FNR family transcriptional regulator
MHMTAHLAAVPGLFLNAECAFFNVGGLCLSLGMSVHDTDRLSTIIAQRLRIKKGAVLYRAGDPLRSLYAVRSGYFKTDHCVPGWTRATDRFPHVGRAAGLRCHQQ